jgi:hypothetical protein
VILINNDGREPCYHIKIAGKIDIAVEANINQRLFLSNNVGYE